MEVVANVALRDMLTRLAGEKGKLGSPGSEPVGGGGSVLVVGWCRSTRAYN
jgi:hypothetical protein